MNTEEKRIYMREYMADLRAKQKAEKQKQRELNTERVRRYRKAHPEQMREYSRLQKQRWRQRQRLIAMMAARGFILASDKSEAEKLDALTHLNRQADELMRELGIEK